MKYTQQIDFDAVFSAMAAKTEPPDNVEALKTKVDRFIAANTDNYLAVLDFLSDAASRANYTQEMRYLYAREIFGKRAATNSYGLVSKQQWVLAYQKAREMLQHREFYYRGSMGELYYTIAATFFLEQYRYDDEVKVAQGDICLDCGGLFGDFAVWAGEYGAAAVYSFEPIFESAEIMRKNFRIYANAGTALHSVNLAVGDHIGQVTFSSDANVPGSSSVNVKGSLIISMTTLDAWCAQQGVTPDFIKMDIEGYEPLALDGARGVIENNAPKLAICLYHKFSHMWELPLQIAEYNGCYKFYCKKGHPSQEFILFAKP